MKIIAVSSGKGGAGKSCVAAYTGLALARTGKKVLVMELGHDPRSADIILGLPDTSLYSLQDVLSETCIVDKAVAISPLDENLHLIPCSLSLHNLPVSGAEFDAVLAGLPDEYDYIVLDGVDFSVFPAGRVDVALNVLNPEWISIRAAAELTQQLSDAGDIKLVINKVPPQIMPMKTLEDFDDVIDFVGAGLIAVIPESPKMRYASNNAANLDEDSVIPKIFSALAARLEGEAVPLLIR